MKKIRFIISKIRYILGVLLLIVSGQLSFAQEGADSAAVEKINPALNFLVSKNSDGTRVLSATFSYRDKETREFVNVSDIELNFLTGIEPVTKIGTFKTDVKGNAKCSLPVDFNYSRNDSGLIHFAVEFAGNDKFESSSSEVDLMDLKLEMILEVIDSVKTIKVQASKILANGNTLPLNEETIPVFVGRMFGHMKIGEITFSEGEGTLEFPSGIPGDTLGMLTVIAKFEDNEVYGNVIKSESIAWGNKTSHHTVYHPRSLWTAVAPIWMIVTLSIMLLGVWGHYIYVVIELIRLKKVKPDKPYVI